VSKFPDTCRPRTSTARCTNSITAMRVSTSATPPLLTYPSSLPSSRHDPRTLDPNPSVARTDVSGNGAPNDTLRLAPGRGKKRHGARRPSGMSLSKPIAQLIGEGSSWWGGGARVVFSSAASLCGNIGEMRTHR